MWDSKSIADKLRILDFGRELQSHQIELSLFDKDKQCGIGIDGNGNTVLVLPGQSDVLAFQTEYASYDPWADLIVFNTSESLSGVSILRCAIDFSDSSKIEAASAIFYGLLDLQEQFGNSGNAIWQLKALFENRLNFEVPVSRITGLIGEILIILAAKNPAIALKYWHSNIDDKYDFSGSNFRLEAKTTTGEQRNHHFSSHQIPGDVPEKTFIASVRVVKVENGITLIDLINSIVPKLSSRDAEKFIEIVYRTLGVPADLVLNYQFDLSASLESIRIIRNVDVPRPHGGIGVISMEWLASLDGLDLQHFKEDFFENFI